MASRAQTENMYVPCGLPPVAQLNVALADHAWASVHTPDGAFSQNSNRGLEQPTAVPETVTAVPMLAVAAGVATAVIVEHVGVSVYWNALTASYVNGAVPLDPGLLRSRAQTAKR